MTGTHLTEPRRFLSAVLTVALVAPLADAADVVEYYHLDAIGNVRVITDQNKNVIERHDYLPFGEECTTGPCAGNPGVGAGQPRKFTGKERDTETGLDYFGARYYGSGLGRFTSVDPVYTVSANLVDPQRWNRYAHGRNNPLRYVDPDGRAIETPWDALNVGLGVASLTANVAAGNVGGAIVDALGIAYDATATAVPLVPGGAGTAIRAARAADKAVELVRAGDQGLDAASLAGRGQDAADAFGVIYRRTDPKTGAEYVGRSKSEDAFLNRQRAHDRNLGTKHEYEVIDRVAPGPSLRLAEESAIRTRGGPGRLANKRYEMNDAAYRACGGTCDKP